MVGLGGLLMNIAVAWGLAAWIGLNRDDKAFVVPVITSQPDQWWLIERRRGFGSQALFQVFPVRQIEPGENNMTSFYYYAQGGQGHMSSSPTRNAPDRNCNVVRLNWSRLGPIAEGSAIEVRAEQVRGWPMPALWSSLWVWDTEARQRNRHPGRLSAGIALPESRFTTPIKGLCVPTLPLSPVWPGFMVNSAAYAASLGLARAGCRSGANWIRRRRGRCVRCGYDLRGRLDAGCPECGWNRS